MAAFSNSVRSFRTGFILIAASCFLIGFVAQIFFFSSNQHNSSHSSFHPKDIIDDHLSKGLDRGDFQRLLEIEKKFADQFSELENLKRLIGINKARLAANEEPRIIYPDKQLELPTNTSPTTSLFLSAVANHVVPPIVRSWRNAKLDWHSLLPIHNSIWERYGTPEKGQGLRLLVSKEIQVTDYLTQFHESGLSAKYGKNHGVLSQYSGCNTFQSACMIHNEETCNSDEICSWSSEGMLCMDRTAADSESVKETTSCAIPKKVNEEGTLLEADKLECKFYINQPAIFTTIDSESQSMFYHWWASWSSIRTFWAIDLNSSRNVHFFLKTINDPMFFDFFGFISDNCWRRSTTSFVQIPPGACFCNSYDLSASQSGSTSKESASQIIEYLNLQDVKPPSKKIKIGIISRRLKRFILNEYELVAAVEMMGFECVLLPLEVMTVYEQMMEMRSLDVLIGIHGSALDNSVFLHEGIYVHSNIAHMSPLFLSICFYYLLDGFISLAFF